MGKQLNALILCMLFIPLATAQNDTIFDKVFSRTEGIAPADVSSGTITGVPSPETHVSRLLLTNARNGSMIAGVHVIIETESLKTLSYVGVSGVLDLPFKEGIYTIILKADDISTPGGDYYTKETIDVANTTEIKLFPVGSARGQVWDKEMLVRNAHVSFSCSGLYGDTETIETDEYGTFISQWLPLGQCTIRATDGKKAGFATVTITQGNLVDVTIELERNLSSSSYLLIGLLALLLIITLFSLYRFFRRKVRHQKTHAKEAIATESACPKRLQDITKTLTKKEREIIDLIYKEKEVTQAKIVYTLLLPKTSVIRLLSSLESKNIVTIQKYGKAKKVRLTDWILDKNEKKD